jgi:hypothetical protein
MCGNVCQRGISNKKRERFQKNLLVIWRHLSSNDNKNVPEQKAMTVDTDGYEEAFENIERACFRVVKNLQK